MSKLSSHIGGGSSNYLKAHDIPEFKEVSLTIDRLEEKVFDNDRGSERKWILYFRGKEKGLVMNQTNLKTLIASCGDHDPSEYTGKDIILYRTVTDFRGEQVDCLRLRPVSQVADDIDLPF